MMKDNDRHFLIQLASMTNLNAEVRFAAEAAGRALKFEAEQILKAEEAAELPGRRNGKKNVVDVKA